MIRQRTWQKAEPLYSRISSFFTRHFCSRLRYNYELKWLNCHKMRRGLSSKRKYNVSSCFNLNAIFVVLVPCASKIFWCIGIFLLSCCKSRPNEPPYADQDANWIKKPWMLCSLSLLDELWTTMEPANTASSQVLGNFAAVWQQFFYCSQHFVPQFWNTPKTTRCNPHKVFSCPRLVVFYCINRICFFFFNRCIAKPKPKQL